MRTQFRRLLTVMVIILCMLAVSSAAPAAPGDNAGNVITPAFSDVAPGNSNILYINYLSSRGMVGGFPDGTYRPGDGLTRAEAAAVLVKAAGLAAGGGTSGFSDVNGHWAIGVINAATAAGLLQGYPDGTFRPDAMLTRAEGISLFLRLSRQPDPGVALPQLADVSRGHWAERPVAIGLASGMVKAGGPDGKSFFPDANLTRGDMARLLGVLLTRDPNLSRTELIVTVKALSGTASITRRVSQETEELAPGSTVTVGAGDIIKTGRGSTAEVILPDGSGMLLEENTQLAVNEARGRSYITSGGRPGVAVDWLSLDMDRGKMFGTLAKYYRQSSGGTPAAGEETTGINNSPLVAGVGAWGIRDALLAAGTGGELPWWETAYQQQVRVQVDMPWGVAGVRGTTWRVALDESGNASFSILEGEGEVTAGGITEVVGERQVITVPYGSAPEQASEMSPEELKEFIKEAVKEWLQQRAEDMQANSELYVQLDEAAPPSIVELINKAIEEAVKEADTTDENRVPSSSGGSSDNDDNDDDDSEPPADQYTIQNPELKWTYETGGMLYYSPAVGPVGTLYFGDNDGSVYALNSNGVELWPYPYIENEGLTTGSTPAVYNGKVYMAMNDIDYTDGLDDTVIMAVYADNGNLINSYNTGNNSFISPPLAIHGGTVYAGIDTSDGGALYAFNPDLTDYWDSYIGAQFPAVNPMNGNIYVFDGSVLKAVYSDGSDIRWSFDLSDYIGEAVTSPPTVSEDGNTVYISTDKGYICAINADEGTEDWWCQLVNDNEVEPIYGSPAIGPGGTLYVGTENGNVYAIDPDDGSVINSWPFETGGAINSSPAVDEDGTVYVYTFDEAGCGAVIALNGNTAEERWTLYTGYTGSYMSPTSSPVIGPDGTIYLAVYNSLIAIGEDAGSAPVLLELPVYFASQEDPYTSISFSKYIKEGGSFDSIALLDEYDHPVNNISLEITGNTLEIHVYGTIEWGEYTLFIPADAVTDLNGIGCSEENVTIYLLD